MINIDWHSAFSHVLINPRTSESDQLRLQGILDVAQQPGHLWLATSSGTKWVGLSKEAVLYSANAVNDNLQSNSMDHWINVLPSFHVGGLAIWARSHLSGAAVHNLDGKWDPLAFCRYTSEHFGTLTSLVPTQLYDLVQLKLPCPPSLRAVIIGGGALSSELYRDATKLGWKLLLSYGMTECASQIATADLGGSGQLEILPHIEVMVQSNSQLCFKGPSLLSGYVVDRQGQFEFFDPKKEGWFWSEDCGRVEGSFLTPLGRLDEMVKVGGESVNMAALEAILQAAKAELGLQQEVTLIAYPDARLGNVVQLAAVATSNESLTELVAKFDQRALPFERIRAIHLIPYMPKSALSKVLRKEIFNLI